MNDVEGLLEAGAVLPPGTEGGGEDAVPLTARTYRHPALDDRVVVRLVAAELGEGEDLATGFLGLEISAEPEVVGVGKRAALGFPEWVLVHHPEDGHHALALVPELERIARRAKSKPKAALVAFQELAAKLASSVPHLLPTFYERVAREFLAVENPTYAAQMFTRARSAETEHGLPIDEDRLDAVFLEFALAGALQVKTLSAYAAALSERVPADEALRRFIRLCVRRTAGGVPPSARMATDLRRLAKAASGDVQEVEHAYLVEVLSLPTTIRAAAGWWKTHRQALVSLARERPEIRGKLLSLIPDDPEHSGEMPVMWLEILEEAGAIAALCDPDSAPEAARSEDGSVGWLKRMHAFLVRRRRGAHLPALYPLVERMADRLKAELAAIGEGLPAFRQVDLLDLLLSLGVPVADPPYGHSLELADWSRTDGQRDLLALAADHRFHGSFRRSLDALINRHGGAHAFGRLLASPGGRPILTEWMTTVARETIVPSLPRLPEQLGRLERLPGTVLALAEKEVRAVAATDLAPVLVRSLRAGLFDELGWPAWEEALASLGGDKPYQLRVTDAWPYLIVAGNTQVRVIGAEGTVLVHDLRVPAGDAVNGPCFHYVDGELLVYWTSRQRNGGLLGYWHTAADRQQPMTGVISQGVRLGWYRHDIRSLQLPGGGRTTGAGVLHRGDTVLPSFRRVIGDGTSYWVWHPMENGDGHAWHEYDPESGETGRRSEPAFFTDATRGLPEGSAFVSGTLLPAVSGKAGPDGVPVGGTDGWRVTRLPDGSYRGEDLAGNTVTTPAGSRPAGVMFLPGDDRPRALTRNVYEVELIDPDGVVTASARTDGKAGRVTAPLPSPQYWHGMRPRDPRGSEALRRIDEETAAALMKAVQGEGELSELVRALIPEITHEGLAAEVGAVARFAAHRQAALEGIGRRLDDALAPPVAVERFEGPGDMAIRGALNGVLRGRRTSGGGPAFFTSIELMRRAKAGRYADKKCETHIEGIVLPYTTLRAEDLLSIRAAMSYRAVSAFTPVEDRDVLSTLLKAFGELGMTGDDETRARWRVLRLRLEMSALQTEDGKEGHRRALLPLEGGAFLAVVDFAHQQNTGACEFPALFYDPAGRFEAPSTYQVLSSEPLTAPEDGFSPDGLLAEAAARGPVPWFPEAAEEFARLTGVTVTMAKLVVAGLPGIEYWERNFLSAEVRSVLKVKVADAALAKDELSRLDQDFRCALVGALVPADPSRLWTGGPDAAAAAEVWNARFGRRVPVPEALMAEAVKVMRGGWPAGLALPALFDPASAPELTRDLKWTVRGDGVVPEIKGEKGFTSTILVGAVAASAWLAHRLPAGDPLRGRLPAALAAVRERLANPDLLLRLDRYVNLPSFRKLAGSATEAGDGYERYGAVVMATSDNLPYPAIKTALLDAAGEDPYLPALREGAEPTRVETALRFVREERFAALLADPGDPAAGERDADGTWWPQDPSRSVPDLVTEAAERYGLGRDAAAVYLMLLAMPDPTDRDTARWTGWKPVRLKAARAELAATDLVVEARRPRAGRSLFLPGGWNALRAPHLPQEEWKLPLYDLVGGAEPKALLGVLVPAEPVADLYRRAWQRIVEDDVPRFANLEIRRGRRR
ncbi:DNA-binding protein [Actinocorallia populi]|uniref:DNA-binding protein n=1 Tax=Actinocorallia populi TaxID=2079200 RepID=UPI000D08F1BE|nr:DNA-binding protein [Actinocorallia populi]